MCLLVWFTGYAFAVDSQVLKVGAVGLWLILYIYMAVELHRFVTSPLDEDESENENE